MCALDIGQWAEIATDNGHDKKKGKREEKRTDLGVRVSIKSKAINYYYYLDNHQCRGYTTERNLSQVTDTVDLWCILF